MDREIVYLGLGSNLGDKVSNCLNALTALSASGRNEIRTVSPLYKTEPIGYQEQDWFINGVAEISTPLSPHHLMQHLQGIEKEMGRQRHVQWGPRVIDLDILFYGIEVIEVEGLTIPHPRLHERGFVLIPLAEVAPDLIHPVLKKTVMELLKEIEGGGVELYAASPDLALMR